MKSELPTAGERIETSDRIEPGDRIEAGDESETDDQVEADTRGETVQHVRLIKPLAASGDSLLAHAAPCLGSPITRLGADSPFGLALPDAQPTASTMYAPRGVWLDDRRLIICDSGNHRILIWNEVPETDQAPADVVLCQPSFESEGAAAHGRGPENGVHLPTGVIVAEGRLLVCDAWHHRVLVWNRIPERSDVGPDFAIGQGSLSNVEVNRGDSPTLASLYWPYGVAWLDGRLYVADTGNRRVLVWNDLPTEDKPCDFVIGQDDPSGCDENRGGPVAANSFRWPHDLASSQGQLLVADAGNHRVLGFDRHPTGDMAADVVLGQQDFSTAFELPYDAQGTRRLRFPYALDVCDDVLAVADTANNRILFWKAPIEQSVGAPAFDVIGQIDFASNGENRWQSVGDETLCWPYGICFQNGLLAVADSGNNRVMIWDCRAVLELGKSNPSVSSS